MKKFIVIIILVLTAFNYNSYGRIEYRSQKPRGPYNYGAKDLFEGQSLQDDPTYQKAIEAQRALEKVNPLGESTGFKDRITPLLQEADVYKESLDGDFSGTAKEIDQRVTTSKNDMYYAIGILIAGIGLYITIVYKYFNTPDGSKK